MDSTAKPASAAANPDGAQAVRRAMLILRIVAAGRSSGVGLQDIATATGLARPTVHRILSTMLAEGFIEQHPRSRRYAIGEQVSMLALARSKHPALLDAGELFIDAIAREIGDTAFLTVRTGDDTLCLARAMGGYPIQVLFIDVGARRPLGVSSAGIAILAGFPADEAEVFIDRNALRFAPYNTTVATVKKRVAAARAQHYCLASPGLAPGTRALSIPIFDRKGEPSGALTIAAVWQRLRPQREGELLDVLNRYGDRITKQLGALAEARAAP